MNRSAARPAWLLLAATVLALVASLGPLTAPTAQAATDDLTLTSASTYTLVPAKKVIRVVIDVSARNDKPNQTSGGVVTRYFYDSLRIGIQPEATSIKATSGGVNLSTTTRPRDGYKELEVRFRASLFYGRTATARVTFDLPGGAPRSKSEVRSGPAFATFVGWAFGDSGSVRIVIPAGFEAETTGSDVVRTTAGAATVFSATGITDVPDWYVVVNADRKAALTNVRLDLEGGEHLVIHAWPDDPAWKTEVSDLLTKGLPELVKETGLAWPVSGDLDVFEVHTPLLEGYAGIFFEGENRIEISEDLDDLTILHEASHAWFNGDVFQGRWINEGLADTFASMSLDAIGLGPWNPSDVSPTDAAAVKLNDWVFPGRINDDQTDAREQFGYDASWTVLKAIARDVGPEPMRDVLTAAQGHQIAYVGAGAPETLSGPTDWKRLLDLLDERGHAGSADDLFRRWVVTAADAEELDARAAARAEYAGLIAAGGDWLPPMYVRDSMAGWRFGEADARIATAETVLAKRDELATVAAGLGVAAPLDLRAAYQTATDSLDAAAALADGEIADGRLVTTAASAVAAPRDALTSVGLIGTTPDAQLDALRSEFSAGSTTTAADAAALSALIAGAAEVGRGRVILAGAVVLAAVVVIAVLVLLVARSRRRRGGSPAAGAGAAVGAMVRPPGTATLRIAMAHPAPELAAPPEPATTAAEAAPRDADPPHEPATAPVEPDPYATLADQSNAPSEGSGDTDPDGPPTDQGDAS